MSKRMHHKLAVSINSQLTASGWQWTIRGTAWYAYNVMQKQEEQNRIATESARDSHVIQLVSNYTLLLFNTTLAFRQTVVAVATCLLYLSDFRGPMRLTENSEPSLVTQAMFVGALFPKGRQWTKMICFICTSTK